MEGIVNEVRQKALAILLFDTFKHIDKQMNNRIETIAAANANIRQITCAHFMYEGKIWPAMDKEAPSVAILSLHYTLYAEFEETMLMKEEVGYTKFANYFTAILNNSYNNMVLDELLPTYLVNHLRSKLEKDEFQILNAGMTGTICPISIQQTLVDIRKIKEHYYLAKEELQNLLMEKLLFQE